MSGAKSAGLVAGVLLAVGGSLVGGLTTLEHRELRVAYETESARLESGGRYDARRSDELHQAATALITRARQSGWVAALGWVLVALGVGMPRDRQVGALLDLGVAVGLGVSHFYVEDLLGASWAALGAHLAGQAVGAALAWAWLRLRLTSSPASKT